jgi:hypothetical protein
MSDIEVTQAMLRKAATVAGYDWYSEKGEFWVKTKDNPTAKFEPHKNSAQAFELLARLLANPSLEVSVSSLSDILFLESAYTENVMVPFSLQECTNHKATLAAALVLLASRIQDSKENCE